MRDRYEIQSLTPASGFSAVWSQDYGGNVQVEIQPLDFIAVADVKENKHGKWVDSGSDVVGVTLTDGFFQVVDECANFHGIVRTEASWTECLDLLPPKLRSRAIEQTENTDQQLEGKLLNA